MASDVIPAASSALLATSTAFTRARIAARDESKDFFNYWLIVPRGASIDAARGMARCRHLGEDGFVDQVLAPDGAWVESGLIKESQRGGSAFQLIEIPPAEAPALIPRIRARMQTGPSAPDAPRTAPSHGT